MTDLANKVIKNLNSRCSICKLDKEVSENNIILTYRFDENDKKINIRLNEDMAKLIFLYGLMNNISYNMNSNYSFDTIEEKDSIVAKEYIKLFSDELFFPKLEMQKNKYIVISHHFNIINIPDNRLSITYTSKFGFISNLSDNYKKYSRKKYNFNIELDYKSVFDIMKFFYEKIN